MQQSSLREEGESHSWNVGDVLAGARGGAELTEQLRLCTKFSQELPRIRFLQTSGSGVLVLPTQKYPSRGKERGRRRLAQPGKGCSSHSYARHRRVPLTQLLGLALQQVQRQKQGPQVQGRRSPLGQLLLALNLSPFSPWSYQGWIYTVSKILQHLDSFHSFVDLVKLASPFFSSEKEPKDMSVPPKRLCRGRAKNTALNRAIHLVA